jgi:hypothetical protein
MSLKLTPDRTDAISAAIREIGRHWQDATLAADTEAARKALSEVRFATVRAVTLINDAEDATRAEARQHIGEAA